MVLNGSIRERVWQMLSCGGYSRSRKVSSDGCEALYAKAGVPFLPAARRFYERCSGLFSDCEIIFETGSDSREFYFYLYLIWGKTPPSSCIRRIMTREHLQGKESVRTRLPLRRRQERRFHLSELLGIIILQRCMWRRTECCIASMSMNLMSVYLRMLKKFLLMNYRCIGRYG
jgi:hypothetical protein